MVTVTGATVGNEKSRHSQLVKGSASNKKKAFDFVDTVLEITSPKQVVRDKYYYNTDFEAQDLVF